MRGGDSGKPGRTGWDRVRVGSGHRVDHTHTHTAFTPPAAACLRADTASGISLSQRTRVRVNLGHRHLDAAASSQSHHGCAASRWGVFFSLFSPVAESPSCSDVGGAYLRKPMGDRARHGLHTKAFPFLLFSLFLFRTTLPHFSPPLSKHFISGLRRTELKSTGPRPAVAR